MVGITDWIVVAATVVIAGFAVTNHLLSRAIAYLAGSESRREVQKDLKEAADKRAGNFSRKQ